MKYMPLPPIKYIPLKRIECIKLVRDGFNITTPEADKIVKGFFDVYPYRPDWGLGYSDQREIFFLLIYAEKIIKGEWIIDYDKTRIAKTFEQVNYMHLRNIQTSIDGKV